MKIREYAKSVGFEVIGKLTRRPEWEYETNGFDGSRRHSGVKSYSDDGETSITSVNAVFVSFRRMIV